MDAVNIPNLVTNASDPNTLQKAKEDASYFIYGNRQSTHNTCAATLSYLLEGAGIDVAVLAGVKVLAAALEDDRLWQRLGDGDPIAIGDVGVFAYDDNHVDHGLHHIYLIIDASDQNTPLIADNQGPGIHSRPVSGGPMLGIGYASPTNYFLRAT